MNGGGDVRKRRLLVIYPTSRKKLLTGGALYSGGEEESLREGAGANTAVGYDKGSENITFDVHSVWGEEGTPKRQADQAKGGWAILPVTG